MERPDLMDTPSEQPPPRTGATVLTIAHNRRRELTKAAVGNRGAHRSHPIGIHASDGPPRPRR